MSPNLRPRMMKKKMNSTMPKITSSPQQPPEESSNGLRSNKTSKVVAPDERLRKLYRKGPAAYGCVKSLQKASKLPEKTIDSFLHTQNAYIKHKTYRKKFPRLKVKVFDLNEIWSLDLAHIDKLAKYNGDVNYLLLAGCCRLLISIFTCTTNEVKACYNMYGSIQKNDKSEATKEGLG